VRRWTLVTLICLVVLLVGTAVAQLILANRDIERFPGPVPGTPLPTASP
jgi:hypothetical protein